MKNGVFVPVTRIKSSPDVKTTGKHASTPASRPSRSRESTWTGSSAKTTRSSKT
nr:MAG TPA: hypothetical protein [Caudoviricetes sp.]